MGREDLAPPQVHRVKVGSMNWGGVQEDHMTSWYHWEVVGTVAFLNHEVIGITGINPTWNEWLRRNFYGYVHSPVQ